MDEFTEFVVARSARLARIAYLLTGDRQVAEDLLQETLARVAQRWSALVRSGDPEPYVRRVLYNLAVDGLRRRRRMALLDQSVAARQAPELCGSRDEPEQVARRVTLRNALARLTPRQRAVLVLRFYEDRTEAQAADLLGCSVNTVKSQTRHALDRLRTLAPDILEAFGPANPVEVRHD